MPLRRQLEFAFESPTTLTRRLSRRPLPQGGGWGEGELEAKACELLRSLGADKLARELRVEWNPRLQTAAGRADYRHRLISLNPRIRDHDVSEVDRTLRHELAHLLAQFRAGRRRILPHGPEWRDACVDLGIADEARCHNMPFAARIFATQFVYRCPHCQREFPRVRRIRRVVACLACCRAYNSGEFDPRFRLRLVARDCSGVCVKRRN